ncbi:hypothetical protein [Bradyrhizobium sp. LMG 9283]|uniref:endonuclease toxin domain-containing protein n=1 Tax=Bradyrhizobium sp. LMG 9283 TaxID=592064 RepID=UPI00388D9C6F
MTLARRSQVQVLQRSTVWSLGSAARGRAIEQALGQNLPGNYPVIDSYVNGVATSIKSIDLNAATYQNAMALTNTLNGYANSIANFIPVNWGAAQLAGSPITARILTLANAICGNSSTAECHRPSYSIRGYARRHRQSSDIPVRHA